MIGFTQYSPAVLSLLVNRDKFYPFVVHNASEITFSKIAEFLGNPDERIKVIMFASMDILVDVLEQFDLNDVKVVVLDTVLNLYRADLEIKDAQRRPDMSFQFFPITPSDLNKALEDSEFGIPEGGISATIDDNILTPRKATIIRNNIVDSANQGSEENDKNTSLRGELSDMVNKIIKETSLGKREGYLVTEGIMKYIVGIYNKRKFRSLCSTYDIEKNHIENIAEFIKNSKGKALRLAFMDINVYNRDIHEAIIGFKANKLDLEFLIAVLPEDKEYGYSIDIPSKLVKSHKNDTRYKSKINDNIENDVEEAPLSIPATVKIGVPEEEIKKSLEEAIKKHESMKKENINSSFEEIEEFNEDDKEANKDELDDITDHELEDKLDESKPILDESSDIN